MTEKTEFRPHSIKQDKLIRSKADFTIVGSGTQWGKSLGGALWIYLQIAEFTDPKDRFLLCAPTYKIMRQSMQPYFLNVMRGLGEFHKADALFQMHDGREIYLRTATDPDSVVGIPNLRAGWLDEANKVPLYFHENLQARAAAVGARLLYTTSPYSRNFLYKNYIKRIKSGELKNIPLIQAASWENPYHTLANPEKRRQMQAQMDPRRFEMVFGGEWGRHAGLVYDCFDEAENVCEPLRLPNGTDYYAGVDWGHTEPFVIVVRAITPDHRHYQVAEFYKTGMTVPAQMAVAKQLQQTFNIRHFYCGHERPENIMLFNQNQIPAVAVPEKDIQVGTDLHYELIKTRRYKVFDKTSPNTLDEYETYHYPEPEDLKPDEDSEDQLPVGQNDHAMSANRFVTLRTYRSHVRFLPNAPEDRHGQAETQSARLKRLMQSRSHRATHTEKWSD